MSKQEIQKNPEADLPTVIDFSADAGAGFEETDRECFAIPFLRMLQSGSPQVKKSEPEYIKGAEEGDLYNTVTERVYKGDDGVIVIPVYFHRHYNLWAANRGGYRGQVTVENAQEVLAGCSKNDKNQDVCPDGTIISDTREHYVLIINPEGTVEPALISLSSTGIKTSKKWMTLQNTLCGTSKPMFSQMYKVTPKAESNDQGNWMGYKIDHISQVTNIDIYNAAKNFREQVRSGAAKAQDPSDDIGF